MPNITSAPPVSVGIAGGFRPPRPQSVWNGPSPYAMPAAPAAPAASAMPTASAPTGGGGGDFPPPPEAGGGVIKGAAPQPEENGSPSLRGLAQAMQPENALTSGRSSLREGLGMRVPSSLDALFGDVRRMY